MSSACPVYGIHLSPGIDETEVVLSWSSPCDDIHEVSYRLRGMAVHNPLSPPSTTPRRDLAAYLPLSGPSISKALVTSVTYSADDLCGPARGPPGPWTARHATLSGLRPGSMYEYWVGDDQYGATLSNFRTPPASPVASQTFLSVQDMGTPPEYPGAAAVMRFLHHEVDQGAAHIIIGGDVAYGDGDQSAWDRFVDLVEPVARHIPLAVGVGNHEWGCDAPDAAALGGSAPYIAADKSGGECAIPLRSRFPMPEARAGEVDASTSSRLSSNPPHWYSYKYGGAHVVVLNTEVRLDAGSPQREWLVDDLQKVDRCLTPWVLVSMHRPMYTTYSKHFKQVAHGLRAAVEDLFLEHGVNLVLSGHTHRYERTCAVARKECVGEEAGGIYHIITGSGGHKITGQGSDHHKQYMEQSIASFGFAKVEMHDGETATVSFIGVDDEASSVLDTFDVRNVHYAAGCANRASNIMEFYPVNESHPVSVPLSISPHGAGLPLDKVVPGGSLAGTGVSTAVLAYAAGPGTRVVHVLLLLVVLLTQVLVAM
jgi:hypothetical protein